MKLKGNVLDPDSSLPFFHEYIFPLCTFLHLADQYESVWNKYMNMMQPIMSQLPYMTCPGNHEKNCGSSACLDYSDNFRVYEHRFRVPSSSSGSPSPLFYRFLILYVVCLFFFFFFMVFFFDEVEFLNLFFARKLLCFFSFSLFYYLFFQ